MNNIKNIFRNGILMTAGLAALCACSDTWDDHYNPNGGLMYDGTTMQAIQEKASDFAEVLSAAGYATELNSESSYTIWAPQNGSFDKAALLAQLKSGDKDEVVKKFINSHVTRYNVSLGVDAQSVKLLNAKIVEMGTISNPTFGAANIVESNLACRNGVLHVIDDDNPYSPNLYEMIEDLQKSSDLDVTFYKFLDECDSFILDENRSLSYGVNEDGLPIYVDSVTERWNRVLGGAEIYEEDSSFTVIIPSAEAFQKRYNEAFKLLKFNPVEDKKKPGRVDSLRHVLSGRFAMKDLIFNNKAGKNASPEDSIVSTDYTGYSNWELSRFYKPFAADGILSRANWTDTVACSNGTAYIMNDYPFSVTEQFFNIRRITPTETYVNRETDAAGKTQPWATAGSTERFYLYGNSLQPLDIIATMDEEDKNGVTVAQLDTLPGNPALKQVQFIYCQPSASTATAKYSIELPNTLAGTYDIKMVTVPIWAKNGYMIGTPNNTRYKFTAFIFERNNGEEAVAQEVGKYGNSGVQLVADEAHADGKNILSRNFDDEMHVLYSDTISLGEYTFKSCYYGMDEPGVILQLQPGGKTAELRNNVFTKDMLISKIILTPVYKEDETAEATENKRR